MHRLRLLAPSLRALRRMRPPAQLLNSLRLFRAGRTVGRDAKADNLNAFEPRRKRSDSEVSSVGSLHGFAETEDVAEDEASQTARKRAKANGTSKATASSSSSSSTSNTTNTSGFFSSLPLNPRDWTPIPAWMGLLVIAVVGYLHVRRRQTRRRAEMLSEQEGGAEVVDVEGPWHVS
jgi:hypothetical protein